MRDCVICQKEIAGRGAQAKYCSTACKEKARPKAGLLDERYKIRLEKRKFLDDYKMNRGCCECGYIKHPAALTFDHIDPSTKSYTPSHLITRSWDALHEEIAKCRVLCANCHNIHTQSGNTIWLL